MDEGRKRTDRMLSEMERKIEREYKQAEKEVEAKLNDYLRRFEAKDAKKLEAVRAGTLTQAEYEKWRVGQVMIGERWKEMKETLSQDLMNADAIAKRVVNGYIPDVYALNHNYGTFEVEKQSLIDTSYTLYDRHTVERLLRDDPQMLPPPGRKTSQAIAEGRAKRWNNQHIQSVMMQSLLQGESIPKIARRLATRVGDSDMKAAIRNARTMTTRAENYGRLDSYKRAEKMGIKMQKQWISTLDHRTRDSHVDLDGEVQDIDHAFSNGLDCPGGMGPPEEVYNCFVGSVCVATDSPIEKSYKHAYKGELITVKTAAGVSFTCTPNHPILTMRGWVAANMLNNGDDILVTRVGAGHGLRVDPNINHVLTRFDTIHKFVKIFGGKRTSALGVNFHGDIAASEVEIITLKRFLRNNRDAMQFKHQDKLALKGSDASFMCKSAFVKHFRRVLEPSLCFIGSLCKAFALLGRSMSHAIKHCFGTVADRNIVFPEYSVDNLPADTMIRSELLNGLTGRIFIDYIVGIDTCISECHVFNLQTENGYYFVNSSINQNDIISNGVVAIAKNCRCTMVAQLKGFETDASDLNLRHDDRLGDMTYDEWKGAKEREEFTVANGKDISQLWKRRPGQFDYERDYNDERYGKKIGGLHGRKNRDRRPHGGNNQE